VIDLKMSVLPITADYADAQIGLPMHHRDPFDRLLIAQAQVENVPIISAGEILERYGITRIWD
jgi:PIN domain nuclease of toxin-antitoxin system